MTKTSHFLDELTKKISKIVPPAMKELSEDFEKNLKNLLHSSFNKLELVTRKEFDIQARVLIKTREKLEKVEKKLVEIEEKLKTSTKSKHK